jgi:hypothetical protein
MTYKEILETLNSDIWNRLSEEEKLDYFQSLENYMAMESNRESCKVKGKFLYTGEEGVVLGAYNPETREIDINVSQFDEYSLYGKEPSRLTQTCLHEGRHALQHQVAEGKVEYPDQEIAHEWKNNLKEGNYISYKRNPKAYYNQPVERDAREFAEKRYAALLDEKEFLENSQDNIVDIKEASNIFSEQMESNNIVAADYQSNGNSECVSQRM